jgi:hypothetical protein
MAKDDWLLFLWLVATAPIWIPLVIWDWLMEKR